MFNDYLMPRVYLRYACSMCFRSHEETFTEPLLGLWTAIKEDKTAMLAYMAILFGIRTPVALFLYRKCKQNGKVYILHQ